MFQEFSPLEYRDPIHYRLWWASKVPVHPNSLQRISEFVGPITEHGDPEAAPVKSCTHSGKKTPTCLHRWSPSPTLLQLRLTHRRDPEAAVIRVELHPAVERTAGYSESHDTPCCFYEHGKMATPWLGHSGCTTDSQLYKWFLTQHI